MLTSIPILCPVCGRVLSASRQSLVCSAGHRFDIARQGYCNLLTVSEKRSRHPGDTREMVASRKAFLDQGHYAPIPLAIAGLLSPLLAPGSSALDVGCGEGYYLSALRPALSLGACCGVDISKDAVRYAAVRDPSIAWLTASAAHLPFPPDSFDLLLSMFSLTVPGEFSRVVRPGGYFLEVRAGRGHLMGLKQIIYSEIHEKAALADPDYPGFSLISSDQISFPVHLSDASSVSALFSMTPHMWRISKDGAARLHKTESLSDTAEVRLRLYRRTP